MARRRQDPRLFEIVCPGKAKHVGRDRWIECAVKAAEIFGRGRVSVNFVSGVEMAIPSGFKTEEEALASVLEGFRYLASHGVTPTHIPFRTVLGAKLASAQRPRTEYVLTVERERRQLLKEHNLLPKPRGASQRPSPLGKQSPLSSSRGISISGDWVDEPGEAC